jgi:poly-gamma-glutamate synthesis protein (capsule biosynthesis protein)
MHLRTRAATLAAIALVAGPLRIAAQSDPALRTPPPAGGPNQQPAASFAFPSPPPVGVKDGFVYAVMGDISGVTPATTKNLADFDQVLKIVRNTDFSLANYEGVAFDVNAKKFPVNELGALFPSDTTFPWDIKNMGVRMVAAANNHSVDYGSESLLESLRLLREAGLPYAGAGATLREARAATSLATPKGKVTVVATAGTFKLNFAAADGRGALVARPGISTVRTTTFQRVTPRVMSQLQALQAASGVAQAGEANPPRELMVLDQIYRLGTAPGLSYRMNSFDFRDLMQSVHTARQNSDFTVFTIHAHQSDTGDDDINPVPADYLIELFHGMVDAGADVVAGHGNHLLRGIEIYKGKPIFYGLASFAFSGRPAGITAGQEPRIIIPNPPPPGQPSDASIRPLPGGGPPLTMWESIFATTTWSGGKLKEIRIYPIDLNAAGAKPKGIPSFADPALAAKILGEVKRLSTPFGTKVEIEGNVGVIRP